jgi:GGDEF domain-containing protein
MELKNETTTIVKSIKMLESVLRTSPSATQRSHDQADQGPRERPTTPESGPTVGPLAQGEVKKIEKPEDFDYLAQPAGGEQIYLRICKGGTWGEPIAVTASIGLASAQPLWTVDDLVTRADAAMYAAKSRGRNRVEVA